MNCNWKHSIGIIGQLVIVPFSRERKKCQSTTFLYTDFTVSGKRTHTHTSIFSIIFALLNTWHTLFKSIFVLVFYSLKWPNKNETHQFPILQIIEFLSLQPFWTKYSGRFKILWFWHETTFVFVESARRSFEYCIRVYSTANMHYRVRQFYLRRRHRCRCPPLRQPLLKWSMG